MSIPIDREDKPPFDQLVNSVPSTVMRQLVGSRQSEGQKFAFHPEVKKLRLALKTKLQCDLDKFGSSLGLPAARVSELLSAADGDQGKQVDYLMLAWVESSGERATVEEVLRAIYAADDTRALENIADELSDSGVAMQRNVIPKKPSYADSVVIPSPPTQAQFIGENGEMKLSQRLAQMAVVPNSVPKRLESQSELTPVELPPDVSLQMPLEETPQIKKGVTPVQPSSPGTGRHDNEKSSEAQMPMEESFVGPSITSTTSTVVTTFITPQRIVTSDTAYEETKGSHEMVSGDRRMERMQSELEGLMKNMTKIESGLEEVKSDHRRESIYHTQRSDELDSKLKKLEEDNEILKETVRSLQAELVETKQKLKEAQEEVTKLRDEKKDLSNLLSEEKAKLEDERAKFQDERERFRQEAATTERGKAELRESLEEQAEEWKSRQERYERELNEMKAMLFSVKKEIQEYRDQNTTDGSSDTTNQSQGTETGEWTLKNSIGSGGFGEVFKAQRRGCPDIFAAKRIIMRDNDRIDEQEKNVSSFFKEMKALQECRHPRVVRYIDRKVETVKSSVYFYIIMEFMSKGSIADLMKKEGKLDELRVLKFTRQLLEGLQYLHRRNVIHRDIKCSNILLDDNEDVKLADFGCSKFLKSKANSGVKMTGTAWWMAPELVPGGKQSDAASEKSDVWSVGATVVEMLTGKRPFSEYTEKMSIIFGLGQKSLSLDKLITGPGFSDEVQEFLRLCINWEPSERATVADLLNTSFVLP